MGVCYSAIDLCSSQFNRLDCDGNILEGPENVVVSCAAVDVTVTPIEGEDTSSQDPNGSGGYCAERETGGNIEGYEVELTLCSKTDVELMELIGIFDIVKDADGNCVGIKAKCCNDEVCKCDPGEETCDNPGVALHIWHCAWCGKERHPDFKWAVQALPKVKFDPASVSVSRNSEFNTYTLTGRSDCNENYIQGPGAIYPDANGGEGLDSCWAEWLTNIGPSEMCNCDVCGYAEEGTYVSGVKK